MELHLMLPLLLAALYPHDAQGSNSAGTDCCVKLDAGHIPAWILQSYSIQGPEHGCNIQAVVFISKWGKKLCAPHDTPWVPRLMKKLQEDLKAGAKPKQQKQAAKSSRPWLSPVQEAGGQEKHPWDGVPSQLPVKMGPCWGWGKGRLASPDLPPCPPWPKVVAPDCCLRLSAKRIPPWTLQSYSVQSLETGCLVPAVMFITRWGKKLCAPPDAPWVPTLMKKLDEDPQAVAKPQQKGAAKSRRRRIQILEEHLIPTQRPRALPGNPWGERQHCGGTGIPGPVPIEILHVLIVVTGEML
ncbi:PREDICTED: uncharacterized protein LOC109298272 [Gavialis gangeticus]|uniref:uncharacterized protein LOC109298272 n=1 Tax=Gavialis gangeticus TaxID=94835 RepID=UPI00092F8FD0|nr:PREDICTED: uncharacterized protein LOC109298272 [Gavialis gangeticus]